ncbi:hypothetical protein [Streptomyces hesseae]|uniref:Integral membrane protein n=1 Tax=Streptomyces hesseae TaxID=3075519 RepID=A0ABU2SGM2_9ACTN|nr:hypothetical protein [Streptomyces sp. DSM 40473]MDT0448131.1 hypothetical protein [Streptomyces sp. DSM 40473]
MHPKTAGRSVWTWSAVAASWAGLVVEMSLVATVLFLWGITHLAPDAGSPALPVLFLPLWLGILAVLSAILTPLLVMPAATLAHRAGTRGKGGDAWWWTPAGAAVVAGAAVGATGLVTWAGAGAVGAPETYVWWWLAVTALVVPAALLARLSACRTAQGRPGGLVRPVLAKGCGGVVGFFALTVAVMLLVDTVVN